MPSQSTQSGFNTTRAYAGTLVAGGRSTHPDQPRSALSCSGIIQERQQPSLALRLRPFGMLFVRGVFREGEPALPL